MSDCTERGAAQAEGQEGMSNQLSLSVLDRMRALLPQMTADIRELVECESPSADAGAVARSADVVARLGTRLLGVAPERLGPAHLRWQFGGPARVLSQPAAEDRMQPRALLLGHHDTVWPLGSLATRPYAISGGVLRVYQFRHFRAVSSYPSIADFI
jgi:glutamate carboxypeptidase